MWKQQYLVDHVLKGKPGFYHICVSLPLGQVSSNVAEKSQSHEGFWLETCDQYMLEFLLHATFAGSDPERDVHLPRTLLHSSGRLALKYRFRIGHHVYCTLHVQCAKRDPVRIWSFWCSSSAVWHDSKGPNAICSHLQIL